jgi:uncharacterized protein
VEAADIHYRRMYWLMAVGILHAYFLWWGEILYPYALLGFFVWPYFLGVHFTAVPG